MIVVHNITIEIRRSSELIMREIMDMIMDMDMKLWIYFNNLSIKGTFIDPSRRKKMNNFQNMNVYQMKEYLHNKRKYIGKNI